MDALGKIPAKEARIKEAYRNGIDTLEEYQQNKELLRQEEAGLKAQIEACVPARSESPDDLRAAMAERIHGISDILSSDVFTPQQKSAALRTIVSKIVYHRETDICEIFYYYS